MQERMVTLMRYQDIDQAMYHQEMLENAGISTTIVDNSKTDEFDAIPTLVDDLEQAALPALGGPVQLQVPESQAKMAGEVLAEGYDEAMDGNPATI